MCQNFLHAEPLHQLYKTVQKYTPFIPESSEQRPVHCQPRLSQHQHEETRSNRYHHHSRDLDSGDSRVEVPASIHDSQSIPTVQGMTR